MGGAEASERCRRGVGSHESGAPVQVDRLAAAEESGTGAEGDCKEGLAEESAER